MNSVTQKIGIPQGVGMLVAALLGSGVFIIPAIAASIAGTWSLVAWLIMGALMLPIVFTFASLGRKLPHAGGTAYFVQTAFGDKAARIVSWLFVWVVALGAPVIIITGANFLTNGLVSLGIFSSNNQDTLFVMAVGMLVLLLLVNLLGLKSSALIQSILSVLVVACLVYVSLESQLSMPTVLPNTQFSLNDIALSATYILWCFLGIEAIAHLSDDFKRPERDFPMTIIIGIVITLIVYCLISISLLKLGFYGTETQNLNSVIHLVQASLGEQAYFIVAMAGFLTCFISVSLYFNGFARLLVSMAEHQQITPIFSRKNTYNVPYMGLLFAVMITLLMLLFYRFSHLDIEGLIAYANGLFILIYLAACLAGIKLLSKRHKGYAVLASLTCVLLFISLGAHAMFAVALLLVLFVYYRLKTADKKIVR